MDPTTAITFDGLRMAVYIQGLLWVGLRIGAVLMVAPLLGTRAVPARIRLGLAVALTVAFAPMLMPENPRIAFDATTVLMVVQETVIGLAIGYIFRLAFEAGALAGELVSQGMGLGFAQMADPMRGTQSPVLGQWFMLILGLLFFATDTHIALISLVVDSYAKLPIGQPLADAQTLIAGVPAFLSHALVVGVQLALPIVIAMMVVNLSFGVLARAAPALNPIAIGMPAALFVGLVLLVFVVPQLLAPIAQLFVSAAQAALGLMG